MGGCNYVELIDINPDVIDAINAGKVPFQEEGAEEILREALLNGTLKATSNMKTVRKADAVIFVTGTLVDEHLNPRIRDVIGVIKLYLLGIIS